MNSSRPARPSSSNSAVSTLVGDRARALHLRQARSACRSRSASRPRRRPRAPRRPPASRSSAVWLTQTWASIPQTQRLIAAAEVEAVGLEPPRRRSFSIRHGPLGQPLGDLGHGRPEALRVLLGDDDRDRRSPRRRATSVAVAAGDPVELRDRLAKALLDVDHHQRRPLWIEPALDRAHVARPPSRSCAGGRRPGRRRRSSAPGRVSVRAREARVRRAALVAVLADHPLGLEVDQRQVRLARPARSAALEARTAPPPAVMRSTSGPSVERPRAGPARCAAPRRPSRGPSRPSPPARRAPPSPRRRAGRGRWRRSRSCRRAGPRSGPGGRPRLRSGGFILKRASRAATASSVSVRWCGRRLAADRDPGRLGGARRLDRLARREVLDVDPGVLVERRARQSRAIIVDSETDGTPASPSAAETAPSCMTPSPESSGSSSCRAIGRPPRRWYWSARRSTRALRIGRPSSVKPTAPGLAQLGHLGQLLARHPVGDGGDEADRDRRPRPRARFAERARASPAASTGGSVLAIATIPQ